MKEFEKNQNTQWKVPFFTIALGQTISLIGSSAVQFSMIWWLASETDSALMMALSGLLAFLPQMLLGPFAGVWIDRMKRKNVIIIADLFMGLVAVAFAAMFLVEKPPYWMACVVLGMRAVGNVFHTPAIQAVIPLLVPQEALVKANGWSQFMQSGAFMLGPVLGAAMYAMLSLPVILLTDLIGALVAVGTVAAVKIPELPPREDTAPHFWNELKSGAAILKKERRIFAVTISGAACMVFFMPLSSFYPLMTSGHFQATPWHASVVELLYACGMMACSFWLGVRGIRHKYRGIHAGMLLLGVTSLICGLLPSDMVWFWVFAGVCTFMGASGNLYNIPYVSLLQERIPPEALGRVFSLIASAVSFSMPLGLLISGPIAEKYGVPLWFLVSGIAIVLITAVSALLIRLHDDPKLPEN